MIYTVAVYVCDECNMVGVGEDDQVCVQCGNPMKLVEFERKAEPCPVCGGIGGDRYNCKTMFPTSTGI